MAMKLTLKHAIVANNAALVAGEGRKRPGREGNPHALSATSPDDGRSRLGLDRSRSMTWRFVYLRGGSF